MNEKKKSETDSRAYLESCIKSAGRIRAGGRRETTRREKMKQRKGPKKQQRKPELN